MRPPFWVVYQEMDGRWTWWFRPSTFYIVRPSRSFATKYGALQAIRDLSREGFMSGAPIEVHD